MNLIAATTKLSLEAFHKSAAEMLFPAKPVASTTASKSSTSVLETPARYKRRQPLGDAEINSIMVVEYDFFAYMTVGRRFLTVILFIELYTSCFVVFVGNEVFILSEWAKVTNI